MARRELGPASLAVVQAVAAWTSDPGVPLTVACSGGADSMALAGAAALLARRDVELASRLGALVVDHGLQPGSDQLAADVLARLADLGLRAESRRVEVDPDSPAGMEAAARESRYAALAATDGRVLLGHTLDDQAETVLLGLARGSGTRSLSGMAARFSLGAAEFVRPLLGLRRSVTEQACHEWGLPVWYDPHNQDKRFRRVRVRTSVLPTLEAELGPGIAEALARTAALARADADELDAQAGALQPAAGEPLSVQLLQAQPPAIGGRLLRAWLIAGGVSEPSNAHLQAAWGLVDDWRGQAGIDLPGGLRLVRRAGLLELTHPEG